MLFRSERELASLEVKPIEDADRKKGIDPAVKGFHETASKLADAQRGWKDFRNGVLPDPPYQPLSHQYPRTTSGRRAALANWITSVRNPLTARVGVNHIWMRHFHQPLVSTVFDFGRNGSKPSHPELLDWLAVDWMESGWSMKHLHKRIVSSLAYQRLSNVAGNTMKELDPENLRLWRMNTGRMEVEVLRD